VRKEKDLIPLMNRIKSGPITIILVYADWCSHCHSFKPKFDTAARKRTLPYPVAYVEDSMLSMANEKLKSLNGSPNTLSVQGYPTVIAVSNKGQMVKKSIPQETSIKMMNETPMNTPMNTSMNTPMNTPMNEVPVNKASMNEVPPMNTPMNEVHPVVEPVAVEPVVVKSIPSYKPSLENLPMVTNTKLNERNRNQGNEGNQRNQGSLKKSQQTQQTQPIFESIPMKGGNPTVPKYLGGGLLDKLSKTPYQLGSFDKLVAKLKQRK
jgi:thiol-disulfide isomerase/thioredoxin